MTRMRGYLFIGALAFLGSVLLPGRAATQGLAEGVDLPRQYLVEISGTVLNETFSGAQALLTLTQATGRTDGNLLALTIESYPEPNGRNSFSWDSRYTEMTSFANDITCRIKNNSLRPLPIHFFFLSSDVRRDQGAALEESAVKKATLPTLVPARAGQLKLRIYSNTVSGTVWMKGHDPAEKAFVLYSARFHGKKTHQLKPKQGIKGGTTETRD